MSYRLFNLLIKSIAILPFRLLYLLSDFLYLILYYIVGYRRKVVRKNLAESFPEKSPHELKIIEKKFYRFFADNLLETCKMSKMSAEEFSKRMKFTNIEEINSILRSGKSIGIYLGHYGNWEWISSIPIHLEKNIVPAQIYHKLSNEAADRIMLENREAHGSVSVDMHHTARFITELVRKKEVCIIGFIADQSPRKRELKYFLPFLNHRTPVMVGSEKIIKHFGFDAWYGKTKRVKRGFYEVEFIHLHDNPDSLPDFEMTDIYFKLLEDTIKEQPELYLWSHRRFKFAEVLQKRDGEGNN